MNLEASGEKFLNIDSHLFTGWGGSDDLQVRKS